jgi:hypothetical protein
MMRDHDLKLGNDLAAVKASQRSEVERAEKTAGLVAQYNSVRDARNQNQLRDKIAQLYYYYNQNYFTKECLEQQKSDAEKGYQQYVDAVRAASQQQ